MDVPYDTLVDLFPACAGVIPREGTYTFSGDSFPRMRGGCLLYTSQGEKTAYVTERYYLCDAVFLVGLESEDREFLQSLEQALRAPAFPLFLGRRSCPPSLPIALGIREGSLVEELKQEPWLASRWMQRQYRERPLLRLMTDSGCGGRKMGIQRDFPAVSYTHLDVYKRQELLGIK